MADEIMNNVAEVATDVVEEVVAEKVREGLQFNNWEALGIAGGIFALGYGTCKLVEKLRAKKAQKAEQAEMEKKGFFGKIFHKGKKAVEAAAEELKPEETAEK